MKRRLGARAVAGLQPRVAEPQLRLAVARIVADDPFERREQRRARELARRHLRDPRGQLAPILRIGTIARLRIADCGLRAGAVAERAQALGGLAADRRAVAFSESVE